MTSCRKGWCHYNLYLKLPNPFFNVYMFIFKHNMLLQRYDVRSSFSSIYLVFSMRHNMYIDGI